MKKLMSFICILVFLLTQTVFVFAADENVAKGKAVEASSEESGKGNVAVNAVDGDETTRWCANDGTFPAWLTVDLGASTNLTGAEILWEQAAGGYDYTIEISEDKTNWTKVADVKATTEQTTKDSFTGTGRYVKVTVAAHSGGMWASFFELKVFGAGAAAAPTDTAVAENPKTGDMGVLPYSIILIAALGSLIVFTMSKRKTA